MEEEDARALRLAKAAAEDILADLEADQLDAIRMRVRAGIEDIATGKFTEIQNADGLSAFAEHMKGEGGKLLALRARTSASRSANGRPAEDHSATE